METREYRTIDKSAWNRGPWDDEPDKVQFEDEMTKLPCLIVRGPLNSLCGYVGVHEGHPLFGRRYQEAEVEVHGGLSFANFCAQTDQENRHICHVPAPGEPDRVWWLGFDCGHSWDARPICNSPDGLMDYSMPEATYKSVAYVKAECAQLARQLKAMDTNAE